MQNITIIKNNIKNSFDMNINHLQNLYKDNMERNNDVEYLNHVMQPEINLLQLARDYVLYHEELLKPFNNIFLTDKTFDEQLHELSLTSESVINDFTYHVEDMLEDTFYEHTNFDLNFKETFTELTKEL